MKQCFDCPFECCGNYNSCDELNYGVSNKPFFGSLNTAYTYLTNVKRQPVSYKGFISSLRKYYPKESNNIRYVKFHDFVWNFNNKYKKGFRFRVAFIYTEPCARIRENLFEERDRILKYTGWYPYITGKRASKNVYLYNSRKAHKLNEKLKNNILALGRPISLCDISSNKNSNAILLKCERGDILFDTGFEVKLPDNSNLKAVCVSHFHSDHIKGIYDLLKYDNIVFIMSEITLNLIITLMIDDISNQIEYLEKLTKTTIVLDSSKNSVDFRKYLDVFPIFHCPGSTGFVYRGFPNISVYYFGDVCLNNGFLDFKGQIDNILQNDTNDRKYIIMDAALIGKGEFTIDSDDIPEIIINDAIDLVKKRNVIFLGSSTEILLYSYILLFTNELKLNSTSNLKLSANKFLMNKKTYNAICALWETIIAESRLATNDPFIKNVLGGNRHNFVETHRLYPSSSIKTIDNSENLYCFLDIKDLDNQEIAKRLKGANFILLGHWANRVSIPESVSNLKPRLVLRVSSPDWSFHSTEESIIAAINSWEQYGVKPILFHNYSKVLRKFCKSIECDTDYIRRDEIIIGNADQA